MDWQARGTRILKIVMNALINLLQTYIARIIVLHASVKKGKGEFEH